MESHRGESKSTRQTRQVANGRLRVYKSHKLAVVEAKARDEAVSEGVAQAKNYAGKLAVRFAYATNGQGIYRVDMQTGEEGEATHYPSPEELWNLTFAEAMRGATDSRRYRSRTRADRIRAGITRI